MIFAVNMNNHAEFSLTGIGPNGPVHINLEPFHEALGNLIDEHLPDASQLGVIAAIGSYLAQGMVSSWMNHKGIAPNMQAGADAIAAAGGTAEVIGLATQQGTKLLIDVIVNSTAGLVDLLSEAPDMLDRTIEKAVTGSCDCPTCKANTAASKLAVDNLFARLANKERK